MLFRSYGDDGDDILIGGKENNKLRGESGNDTYSWNLGDGRDLIVDSKGSNRLTFGPGIDWTMVTAAPYGTDLILNIGRDGEYVRIADWFADDSHKLEEIVFADGVVWSREEIDGKIGIVKGTEGNDTLYGTKKKDLLLGLEGNDTLHGRDGDDSLVGGAGADYLYGGKGDDSYVWNPGDGNDVISDSETTQIGRASCRERV